MKKVLMTMVVALMTTVCANAQQMFVKPMVGGTLSTVTKEDQAKMKLGFVGGAEFGYQLSDPFAVTAGVLVSMQGAAMKNSEGIKDVKTTLTYLNIPILANYYIIPGLAIKAGIQPGFLLSAKHKGSFYDGAKWYDMDESGTDGMKKLDLSIPMGLSYEFSDFVIDARYNLGLTKIIKDDDGVIGTDGKNSVIMLTVGYKIPF